MSVHSTEVCFSSFFSRGFTTMTVINPSKKKLAKRTSVHSGLLSCLVFCHLSRFSSLQVRSCSYLLCCVRILFLRSPISIGLKNNESGHSAIEKQTMHVFFFSNLIFSLDGLLHKKLSLKFWDLYSTKSYSSLLK